MRRNVMPRHLKRGIDASAIQAADAKVREMVEQILAVELDDVFLLGPVQEFLNRGTGRGFPV